MEIVQGQAKTWLGPDPKDSKWSAEDSERPVRIRF